jgi:pimeloyl-ACP methyl ester carboxylesterase
VDSPVVQVLKELVPGVTEGELSRGGRMLRWVEAGSGGPVVIMDAALGEPGTMAWAGVLPRIARHGRVIAYDRAGVGLSDPVSPLTLDISIGDLTALVAHAGGPCILVGHSWSGLLAQLVALLTPELVAGLVLVDSAEETYWAWLPAEVRQQTYDVGSALRDKHSRGEHGDMIRDSFGQFAKLLTDDTGLQTRILDGYVACYSKRSQVETVAAEFELLWTSIPEITRIRTEGTLPDVPIMVLSATEGVPEDHRKKWTELHADLAASVPQGRHVILPGVDHGVNQRAADAVAEAIEGVRAAL